MWRTQWLYSSSPIPLITINLISRFDGLTKTDRSVSSYLRSHVMGSWASTPSGCVPFGDAPTANSRLHRSERCICRNVSQIDTVVSPESQTAKPAESDHLSGPQNSFSSPWPLGVRWVIQGSLACSLKVRQASTSNLAPELSISLSKTKGS